MFKIPVFIDTSIIKSENYFRGHKLKNLLKLAEDGKINIYLVDITEKEIRKNMADDINDIRPIIKKFIGDIQSTGKIIKNLDEFKNIWDLQRPEFNEIYDPLIVKLDELITRNFIEIISSDIASVTEVFNDYFENKLPFQSGDKKHEFPDAFVLNTIIKWCKRERTKAYLLSTDPDFLKFSSKTVYTKTLAEYLGLISSFEIDNKQKLQYLDKFVSESGEILKTMILDNFEDEIGYKINERIGRISTYEDSDYEKVEIEDLNIESVNPINYFAADEDNIGVVTFEISASMKVIVDISFSNYDFASYDREDDIWFGVETDYATLETSLDIKFQGDIEFELDENDIINENIEDISELEITSIDLGIDEY